MAINNCVFVGRLVADPTIKKTSNDLVIGDFTIAVDREVKGKTDFVRCTAWRQTAEFVAKYFRKGNMIAVTGRMENNSYEYEGKKRDSWGLNVQSVSFCMTKGDTGETKPIGVTWEDLPDESEDSLPF